MKNMTIARRYAKALLLIGKEDGQAEQYRTELEGFAGLMADSQVEEAICNPLYDEAGRRKVLTTIIDMIQVSGVIRSYLLLLFDKKRIAFIGAISDFYRKLVDELKGIARATLISAKELPEDTIAKIRAALSKRTGKEIVLNVEQDPSLIGGIITKIGDLVLDGSVKTQLLGMRESLTRGEGV